MLSSDPKGGVIPCQTIRVSNPAIFYDLCCKWKNKREMERVDHRYRYRDMLLAGARPSARPPADVTRRAPMSAR